MLLRYQPIESALRRPPCRDADARVDVLLVEDPEAAGLFAGMALFARASLVAFWCGMPLGDCRGELMTGKQLELAGI